MGFWSEESILRFTACKAYTQLFKWNYTIDEDHHVMKAFEGITGCLEDSVLSVQIQAE